MSLMQSSFQPPRNSKYIEIFCYSYFTKIDAHIFLWHLQVTVLATILNTNAMVIQQCSYNNLSLGSSHQEQTVLT